MAKIVLCTLRQCEGDGNFKREKKMTNLKRDMKGMWKQEDEGLAIQYLFNTYIYVFNMYVYICMF